MGEWVKVTAEDGHELSAYVAKPSGDAIGALVLVQEIFGINAHIQSVCDSYAEDGFLVAAPAIFDRIERDVNLNYDAEGKKKAFSLYPQLDPEKSLLDVAAAYQYVKPTGKVGVIGYCYGGLMAWLSAVRGNAHGMHLSAAVGYYAGGIGKFAAEEPTCPVMLHFGAEDSHIGVDQIDAVRNAHPEVQVFVYAGAGHAFSRKPDPDSYNADASMLARKLSLEFLKENLEQIS
ncbi:MAG TPA: dienelactone hydrolase family protein [Acidobacteriaceae bacterium]|jgi:carboxymethylenebutenolidase